MSTPHNPALHIIKSPGRRFEKASDVPVRLCALREILHAGPIIHDEPARGGGRADCVHADLHDLLCVCDRWTNPCVETRVLPRLDLVHELTPDQPLLTQHREDLGLEELAHGLGVDCPGRFEFAVRQEASTG